MALDPSIALQGYQPKSFAEQFSPWVDMATKQQQLRRSKAEMPSIEAQSREAVRTAKRNQAVEDITAKFKKTNKDGTSGFDPEAAANALKEAGFYDEGIKIDKDILDMKAKDLQNTLSAAKNPVEAAKVKAEFDNEVLQKMATTAGQLKDPTARSTFLKNSADYAIKTYGLSPDDPRLKLLSPDQGFQQVGANASPVPAAGPVAGAIEGLGNVQRDPYELKNQEMAATEQEARLSGTGYATKDDTEAPENVQAREYARSLGFDVPKNATRYSISKMPGFAEAQAKAASGSVLSEEARVGATLNANATRAYIESAFQASAIAGTLPKDILSTKLGTIGGGLWQKYVSENPQLAGLQTAIQSHNARFPDDTIDAARLDVRSIISKVEAGAGIADNELKGFNQLQKSTRVPTATTPVRPRAETAVPVLSSKQEFDRLPSGAQFRKKGSNVVHTKD